MEQGPSRFVILLFYTLLVNLMLDMALGHLHFPPGEPELMLDDERR